VTEHIGFRLEIKFINMLRGISHRRTADAAQTAAAESPRVALAPTVSVASDTERLSASLGTGGMEAPLNARISDVVVGRQTSDARPRCGRGAPVRQAVMPKCGAVCLFIFSVIGVHAQSGFFSTATDLVVLHVTVKDRQGRYVTGLTKEAFTVFESTQPRPISVFTDEDAPVTAGLVIDNSGSMRPNRDQVIAAATAFAESSNPQDQMFALLFDEDVRAALPATAPFTSDIPTLRNAVIQTLSTRGRTALYDAIRAGLTYLGRAEHERRVLVVVSDGADNASRATFNDVLMETQASSALVYTVALVDPLARDTNPKALKQIASASGGEAFAPEDVHISDVLRRIAADIRHTYTLGYVSTAAAPEATFRSVRVVVHPPGDGQRLVVRTRPGYRAPNAPGGG
jgi:Ca-activated chloride channel family protein